MKTVIYKSINEVYIGESAIEPMLNQFAKIRHKFIGRTFSNSWNVDKEIIKFNRLVENLFGFDTFALNISPDYDLNAYAWPVDVYRTDEEKKRMIRSLTAAKTGFKHSKEFGHISAICTINKGLLDADNFTDKELVAVMLHEIGHTFFESVMDANCRYTVGKMMLKVFTKANEKLHKIFQSGEKVTDEQIDKHVDEVVDKNQVGFFKKLMNGTINFFKVHSIKSLIKSKHEGVESEEDDIIIIESLDSNMRPTRISYTNEKFADSFSAMYGYAVYLHTAIDKMTTTGYKNAGIEQPKGGLRMILTFAKYMYKDADAYIHDIKDEHPDGLTRIKVSIEYLRKELTKESLDPKMKLELLSQVEALEKIIDDYINFPKDQDNIYVIRKFYTKLYEKYGGDRREQDTDNDAIFREIDKRYEELKKERK